MNKNEVDFYIGLQDRPADWHCKDDDVMQFTALYHTFDTTERGTVISLPSGVHPLLRYEDIVAHLFLQVQLNPELIEEKSRAARQYANQICRKICHNCSHYDMDMILSQDLAQRFEEKNVIHLNCYDCRASRTIVSANNFKKYMLQPDSFYRLWKDALANYHALGRTLVHAKWVTQKVIKAKMAIEKEFREFKKSAWIIHPTQVTGGASTIMPTEFDSPPVTYTEEELQKQIDGAPFFPDTPSPEEVKKTDNLSEILYNRPDYNREDLSLPDSLSEKKRFDKAMKESMAENKDVMQGLADYDKEPIRHSSVKIEIKPDETRSTSPPIEEEEE